MLTALVLVGVIVMMIVSQLKGTVVSARRLVLLPVLLLVIGAADVHGTKGGMHGADLGLMVASAAIAAVIGVAQGFSMRLEARQGALWAQMPVWTLWLWGALIVSRLGFHVMADASGAILAASTGAVLLSLGINRVLQSGVIGLRAASKGIPLPTDGPGGRLLSGLVGQPAGVGRPNNRW
jgi:hypothetical protein